MQKRFVFVALATVAVINVACGGDTASGGGSGATTGGGGTGDGGAGTGGTAGDCTLLPEDPTKYVIVGSWKTADCSGAPIAQSAFPLDDSAGCYCWPGHSGMNSASGFTCDKAAGTFAYDQTPTLTCDPSMGSTHKVWSTTDCKQDVPPTLYGKIIDISACP